MSAAARDDLEWRLMVKLAATKDYRESIKLARELKNVRACAVVFAMTHQAEPLPKTAAVPPPCRCADFDEDCDAVPDKFHCYMHDPEQGYCPFLSGEVKEKP